MPIQRSDMVSVDSVLGRKKLLLLLLVPLLLVTACNSSEKPDALASANSEADRQSAFRVRSDFAAVLNADHGWASEVNEPATIQADQPFRIRFEVERIRGVDLERRYRLEMRRNSGDWQTLSAENFPQPAKELELNFKDRRSGGLREPWQIAKGDNEAKLSWRQDDEGGYLHAASSESALLSLGRYEIPWEPVEFAVDTRLPEREAARAGIVFGYVDAANYYRLDMESGRAISIVRVSGDVESVVASHRFDVKAGQWFELKVIMSGEEVTVEYDDEALVFTQALGDIIPRSPIGFYLPEDSSADFQAFVIEGTPRSPRVSIVASSSFDHGAPAENILPVSDQPFAGGAGVSFADTTPGWSASTAHSEWEFPLVIRRFSDGAALNEEGDSFAFRLVDGSGPVQADDVATVTLDVPKGLLGGTFVETPGRIGPWEASNGDLYFLMEPAETYNALMTVKSSDGGESWREMDGEHRPTTGDLEGFATVQVHNEIHMLHQTSDDVRYHVFRTSDHSSRPDTWSIRDEWVASPEEPPTQVADIAVRSDGSVVGVYAGPSKVHYRIRSPEGDWSDATVLDAGVGPNLSGPVVVKGKNDVVHLSYTGDDGSAWYRQILPNGKVTPRKQLATELGTDSEDVGSILPLVYLAELDTVSVIYRLATGELWERRINSENKLSEPVRVSEREVVQNAVDADQTGADAIAHGTGIQLLFIEEGSGRLFHTSRTHGSNWAEPTVQVEGTEVQWVRGSLLKRQGDSPVYGFIYDAGSDGGSGMNWYGEIPLPSN